MKKVIKIAIFLIGLNIVVYTISYTLLPKHNGYNSIDYFQNNHQLDIIWLGPSTTFYSISPMYIWNKYKVTSFNNAHNGQLLSTYYMLKELGKYNPKLIFFDITMMDIFVRYNSYEKNYIWFLNILNRIEYLKYIDLEYHKSLYFFLLNIFHDRWEDIDESAFINNKLYYYFYGSGLYDARTFYVRQQNKPEVITNKFHFDDKIIKIIHHMAQYIKENNLNVIFWCPPSAMQHRYEMSFLFEDIIKQYNIPYINFFNEIWKYSNIDFSKDFYDISHLNMYGGRKAADYLIEYAMKNYNIKSHKNDPKYASWNEDYIKYARAINKAEINVSKSFIDWLPLSQYDNYTMLISTNGDNVLNRLPQDIKDKFKSLGLTKYETNKGNMKYAAIIDNGKVFYEEVSDKKVEYKGRMKNIVNLLVSSENRKSTINVSGKPRSKNKYGLNFVIYDKVNREIVDSIWIDPRKPDMVRR